MFSPRQEVRSIAFSEAPAEPLAEPEFHRRLLACLERLGRLSRSMMLRDVWRHDAVQDARDLLQDTAARALAKRHTFHGDTDMYPWLQQIMFGLRVNGIRTLWGRAQWRELDEDASESLDDGLEGARELPQDLPDPDAGLDARRALAAMDRVSARRREVLHMHHLQDLSVNEVAARLGVPVPTVKTHLQKGRRELRDITGWEP